MLEAVEKAFLQFISALQIAKLYGIAHPKFAKFRDASFDAFQKAFSGHGELVFGIIGEELAFEKEVLFDVSKAVKPMIVYLKARGIERIAFSPSMIPDELGSFLAFLMTPKEDITKDPQEYLAQAGVRNISVGRIKGTTEKQEAVEAVNYLNLYTVSLETFNHSLENILQAKDVDTLDLRFNVSNVFDNLLLRHQELLKLTVIKRYDTNTFVHVMNVSILSMFFSSKLGLEKEEVLDIGIAALFHDIGKMYISRQLIKKTDKLTDDEFDTIKGHALFGAEIMLKYVDSLGTLPVLAAFEHHLKSNLKGYPKLAFPQKPHLASAIVAVCDIYDALFSRRSYKAGLPPNVVYDILMKEKTKMFFPELVDTFFKIMGVWPIGSIVRLSDGRVAVVRGENEDDIFAPHVAIIFPQGDKQVIDLSRTKGTLAVEKSLDPLSEEGKPFVALI